jgi:hypothetical protein
MISRFAPVNDACRGIRLFPGPLERKHPEAKELQRNCSTGETDDAVQDPHRRSRRGSVSQPDAAPFPEIVPIFLSPLDMGCEYLNRLSCRY